MDLWTFGGADASVASTWFGLRHATLKVLVLQRTVVSSFGCFVFEIWVLRFRVLGASFSRFGCFVSKLGCFVFDIWVLRASVFVFECFVFETTVPIWKSKSFDSQGPEGVHFWLPIIKQGNEAEFRKLTKAGKKVFNMQEMSKIYY